MTTFGSQNKMKTAELQKLNLVDIGLVLLILMLVFLVGALWVVEPDVSSIPLIKSIGLNVIMLSLTIFAALIYIVGYLSGGLRSLKLVTPTWLIAGIVAIPVWLVYNTFLPLASSTGELASAIQTNILAQFFGVEIFNFIQTVWIFAIVESLVFGILLVFLLDVSKETKGSPAWVPIFLLIVLFSALLHGAIALALDTTGSIEFATVIIHQIVAFAIMGVIFIPFKMSATIAFHQVKNAIALQVNPFLWLILFGFYFAMTYLAIAQSKNKSASLKIATGGFKV